MKGKVKFVDELDKIFSNFREEVRKLGVLVHYDFWFNYTQNKIEKMIIYLGDIEQLPNEKKEHFKNLFNNFVKELDKFGINTSPLKKEKSNRISIPEHLYSIEK